LGRCKSILIYLCLPVIFILSGKSLHSQQKGAWILSHILNTDNGLSQNSVNSLYFDKNTGFLWIATESGLVLYNGISTKVFDARNVPAFKMARMWSFFNSPDGRVMIMDKAGTALHVGSNNVDTQHALNYFSYHNGVSAFQRIYMLRDSVDNSQRLKALNDKAGATLNTVLFINDSTTLGFSATAAYIIRNSSSMIPAVLPAHPLFLYVRQGHEIAVLDSVSCSGYYLDVDAKTSIPIKANETALLNGKPVIYADNVSNSHYLLNGKQLYRLEIGKESIKLHLLADLPKVPDNITTISVHPENNQIYIGTLYEGLYIYSAAYFYTYQFTDPTKFRSKKDLPAWSPVRNIYSCVLPDPDHAIIGYLANNKKADRRVLLNLSDASHEFLPMVNTDAFLGAIDKKNKIYLQGDKMKLVSYDYPVADTPHVYNLQTIAFYYDSKYNRMLAAEYQKDFLGVLIEDSLHHFTSYPRQEMGDLISIKRSNGILLVHSQTTLCFVDETNQKLEKICSFDKPCIRDVYIDPEGLVWIGTYGKGIYVYELATKKMYHPKTDSREYLLFSHCIIDDSRGNFFIPTNNGLFRVNRKALIEACKDSTKTLFYHYYDKTNGLFQNEFNGGCIPAYNKLPNGDILLPSIQGLVRVFTNAIATPENYPLFIQQITSRTGSYDLKNNMAFASNERSLSFEINFAQWEYPSTSGLSYRLDDDSSWSFVQAGERKILLTDLNGGKHTLQIRNQFDLEGKKISALTVHFSIRKKYFEQTWFWVLISLALLAVIYTAVSLRNYQLKRQNIQLERKIYQKTLEVRNKNADLQETLQSLNEAMDHLQKNSHFQQKLIGLLGHDIMVPLRYISKVSRQLINYRTKLSEETVLGAIGEIDNTSVQLLYLGESIIHWIKLQEGDFIPKYSWFNLHQLAEDLIDLHQPIAADKKNSIKNEVPETLSCMQEPTIIKIIIHNLLLNANKFTSNGEIIISGEKKGSSIQLTVRDSGVGMDEEQVANLNSMKPVSSRKGTDNEMGWGLGYRFIIDLVKFIKGKISIYSKKGEGTKVTIELASKDTGDDTEI